jgi:hypothetical protein
MLARSARQYNFARWFAYAMVLLAPGAFVVLPAVWLARAVRRWRRARSAVQPQANAAHV